MDLMEVTELMTSWRHVTAKSGSLLLLLKLLLLLLLSSIGNVIGGHGGVYGVVEALVICVIVATIRVCTNNTGCSGVGLRDHPSSVVDVTEACTLHGGQGPTAQRALG